MPYKVREVIKLLKKNGFYETRIVGSHHRYTDGKGHNVTVAYHKLSDEFDPKTYNSMMRQAGLKK